MSANEDTQRDCAEAIRLAGLAVASGDHLGAVLELTTALRKAAILHGTAQYMGGIEHGKLTASRLVAA